MKKIILLICFVSLLSSCKSDKKEKGNPLTDANQLSTKEKIANAYGFENWKKISQIAFTFNVDKDSDHFERSWNWHPKTNDVTLISGSDTIMYNRKHIDSSSMNADKAFINDKYWLLAPFQLVWDQGTSISEAVKAQAPISKTILNKITLIYSNEGGYTPGDAYDFYFGDDYLIKEWVYRKENSGTPSLTTTWENNQDFNGIILALDHLKSEGSFKLYFSNVKIIFD